MSASGSGGSVPRWLLLVFLALVLGTLLGTIVAVSGTEATLVLSRI